ASLFMSTGFMTGFLIYEWLSFSANVLCVNRRTIFTKRIFNSDFTIAKSKYVDHASLSAQAIGSGAFISGFHKAFITNHIILTVNPTGIGCIFPGIRQAFAYRVRTYKAGTL